MSTKILELATAIAAEAARINDYITRNGIGEPSFENLNTSWELPGELEKGRQNILNATIELHERMLKPKELLYSLDQSSNNITSLHAIAAYGIATSLPPGKEATFEQISRHCGLNEHDVRRLLRLAMSYRVFRESRPGTVAHTPASALLAEDRGMQNWLGSLCEEVWPAAVQTVPAMRKWPNSEEPQHSGFCLSHDTDLPMYQELEKHPNRARQFASAMSGYTTGPGFSFDHVIDNFDWTALGSGLVVDCGGSHGDMMISVAQRFPALTCVVQDLDYVINSRPAAPVDLSQRISFMVHDFFTQQPVKGADVYFFRWILHNWSDKYCLLLLQNIVPALKPGSRVLVNDFCLPDPGMLPLLMERRMRMMDIAQLNLLNSRERSEDEYRELFRRADPRFKIVSVKQPPASALSLIEAVWQP